MVDQQPRLRPTAILAIALGALICLALPLAVTVTWGAEANPRRDYPGDFTVYGTAMLQAIAHLAAWLSVGAIVSRLFLQPIDRADGMALPFRDTDLRILRVASAIWAASAFLLVPFHGAAANGVDVRHAIEPGVLKFLISGSFYPRAWILTGLAALLIHTLSWLADRWQGLLVPLWLCIFAVLGPVVIGSVLVGPNHDLGSDAAIVQTVLLTALGGSVVVTALRWANGEALHPLAVRSLTRFGLLTLPIIAVTEIVVLWFKLAGTPPQEHFTGQVGTLRLIGLLVLLAWSVLGLRALRTGHRALLGLALASGLLLVLLGADVASSQVLSPQYFVPVTTAEIFFGFNVDAAPGLWVLASHWRLNLLFAVLATVAVAGYLAAVLRLRRRQVAWPAGRTVAWVLGWFSVLLVTSSGLGRYSGADFAIHMAVHMTLNMLAPLLLVMGGGVTLLLRATTARPRGAATGPHEWLSAILNWPMLRTVYNPLVVFVLFIGSFYGLYFSSAFESMVRYHWAHQLMNLHFLIVGYLFYGLVVGVDRTPRQLPHIGKLGFVLAAMPFHAFFGVIVMTGHTLIAADFYRTLGLPWATDLPGAQYVGGAIAWAGGEPVLLLVVLALGWQWARSDAREARRKDRHFDHGIDEEFEAYNAMMQQLADRTHSSGSPAVSTRAATSPHGSEGHRSS